jgi:transposase
MGKVRRVARPGSQPGGAAGTVAAERPWGETGTIPAPEVVAKATRRRFGAEYKLGIVRETERLTEPGAIGEVLRREGLYSTHLSAWRRERDRGALDAMGARRRGRKADPAQPLRQRITELEREQDRLVERLRQAEAIIAAQKKLSEILVQVSLPRAGSA